YSFTYTLAANGDCEVDTAVFTIEVFDQPEAGDGDDVSFCVTTSGLGTYDLSGLLSGDANTGGTFSVTGGADITGSVVDVSAVGNYSFTYTLAANGDCDGDTAILAIDMSEQPARGNRDYVLLLVTTTGLGTYGLTGLLTGD